MATDSRKPEQTVQEQVKSQSLSHYVLQAFVINCFIFAVVLLGFTIWQYHYLVKKETAIQKASIQLEDQHKCIKCCASHDFYKNCDDCFDRLVTAALDRIAQCTTISPNIFGYRKHQLLAMFIKKRLVDLGKY